MPGSVSSSGRQGRKEYNREGGRRGMEFGGPSALTLRERCLSHSETTAPSLSWASPGKTEERRSDLRPQGGGWNDASPQGYVTPEDTGDLGGSSGWGKAEGPPVGRGSPERRLQRELASPQGALAFALDSGEGTAVSARTHPPDSVTAGLKMGALDHFISVLSTGGLGTTSIHWISRRGQEM